ncbi:gas vesicle protein [Clostridium beijerinckii]|uniref:hypothetical protein n=1 Tax=Clostridium beijerinckii TaxID=1520 RepID=UPI001570F214|nr:hypothetical protein [Clostridium beijerinckii]NRT34119.1 gas vesicle protein [Clostridium beijerinckii]NRT46452.1 gas vesicle protein [Clostridium beijerinckii]NRZ19544.1 gas vesicle protein [Clostridium beijerinckii]
MGSKVKEFIKLPNELVWDIKGKRENTYCYEYSEKLCHIWSIFDCLSNRVGTISFSLEQLLTVVDVKPDPKKGRNVDQFRNVLLGLEEKKFITNVKCDLKTVKYKELITCEYSIPMLVNKYSKDTQFFQVYRDDYLSLLDCETKLNKITLMYVYYYLLSRMQTNKTNITCCYPPYTEITKDLNISEATFNTYLNELVKLKLIAYGNIGFITKNKEEKQANNVYVPHESHLQGALDISKTFWKNEGWVVVGKKVTEINQKIKGYKGQITKQKNQGKDISKLEKKLATLEAKVTNNVDKSLNDIKRDIKKLNDEMNELEDIYKLETDIQEDWKDYFGGRSYYDYEDCETVYEYMKSLHDKQLKELDGNNFVPKNESDPSSIISCQEENYNEICHKIESGQDYWCETNPFENPLKEMFGDDTCYKMDIPKNDIQSNDFKNDYEKYRDKPYEDEIDEILLQKIN